MKNNKRSYAKPMLFVAAMLLLPSLSWAIEAHVQTWANQSNATPGESGATISSSALISVLVTGPAGTPASNLGANVGDGTSAITLPTGWTLKTDFNVSSGGCLMTPTQFSNSGSGVYTIRVVPFTSNPDCAWLAGEYHYAVRIAKNGYRGSGLGVVWMEDHGQ